LAYPLQAQERVPAQITEHVKKCNHCLEEIDRLREALSENNGSEPNGKEARDYTAKILEQHFHFIGKTVTCNIVRPFIPALSKPDLAIRIPTPITVHLGNCKQCSSDLEMIRRCNLNSNQQVMLSKLFEGTEDIVEARQELDSRLYNIVESPESGISTIFTVDASEESVDSYESIIPSVLVTIEDGGVNKAIPPTSINPETGSTVKQKFPSERLKFLCKTGLASAAVILIAFSVFFFNRTPKEITLDGLHKAVVAAGNVYITTVKADEGSLSEEKWVSRTLKTYLAKNQHRMAMWDLEKNIIRRKGSDISEVDKMTGLTFAGIAREMEGTLGIIPFESITDIPPDARWELLGSEALKTAPHGTDGYMLQWTELKPDGLVQFRKWLVFIDPHKNLPVKTELYSKYLPEGKYALESTQTIQYLNNSQMKGILDDFSR
jgi:hypothetical protein